MTTEPSRAVHSGNVGFILHNFLLLLLLDDQDVHDQLCSTALRLEKISWRWDIKVGRGGSQPRPLFYCGDHLPVLNWLKLYLWEDAFVFSLRREDEMEGTVCRIQRLATQNLPLVGEMATQQEKGMKQKSSGFYAEKPAGWNKERERETEWDRYWSTDTVSDPQHALAR